MIATLDLSNGVTLHSGVTCVGKVHITCVLPNIGGCNNFTNTAGGSLKKFFIYSVQLAVIAVGSPMLLRNSLIDSSLRALKDAVGKITLEYGNKVYCRISLPALSTSPLGVYQVASRLSTVFHYSQVVAFP